MKILQINTTVNSGSTGRIAEDIGRILIENGHESYIAFGRGNQSSKSKLIKIGTKFDFYFHGFITAIFDRHGFGSKRATLNLIKKIEEINPDAIGLHNLHGYYINIEVLFNYLTFKKIPVVWTLHDCWAFTGHCTFFDSVNCEKWKIQCFKCPKTKFYPKSFLIDNSKKNFLDKRKIFNQIVNGNIITPSDWLKNNVDNSFLNYKTTTIFNGVDLEIFNRKYKESEIKKKYKLSDLKIVLGVASIWNKRKGLSDFIILNKENKSDFQIILVGLNDRQIKDLPFGIIGIKRTENTNELAELYSLADVFVNPTYQDNFPTTNLESLACGTPVITYNTGGSPEAINKETGIVVPKGNIIELEKAIFTILKNGKNYYTQACRNRAEKLFDKNDRFLEYLKIYENITKKNI